MTDKEKIRELIEKRYKYWKEKEFNSHSIESEIRMSECQHLLLMINSLQEEPISEDLEEAAKIYSNNLDNIYGSIGEQTRNAFKAGANWKREQIAKENMLLPFKEYDNLMESINKRKKEGYEAGHKQGLVDLKSEQKSTLAEIPFGVKDSELIEETISIPEGCYVIIKDNKIIIRKEKFV